MRRLIDHRDFDHPWQRPTFDAAAKMDSLVQDISALAAIIKKGSVGDTLRTDMAPLVHWSERLAQRERVSPRDYGHLEGELRRTLRGRGRWNWSRKGRGKFFAEGLPREQVLLRREKLQESIQAFVALADGDLAALLQAELRPVVDAYDELKRRHGVLDFVDLLLFARELLRTQPSVRDELRARYRHIYVDEFQDTDPLQVEVIRILAEDDAGKLESGKLFVVGDPKQSIYRFRRADVGVYQDVKSELCDAGAEVLQLRASFRALPAIQHAINMSFAPVFRKQSEANRRFQSEYVELGAVREARDDQPAVVALSVPDPYGYRDVTKTAVSASTPEAVAAFYRMGCRKIGLDRRRRC